MRRFVVSVLFATWLVAGVAAAAGPPPGTPVEVPEPTAQALAYFHGGTILWVVGTVLGFAFPLLILFTGFSARVRDLAQRLGRKRYFTIVIYLVVFSVVMFVLDLPMSYYSGYVRQHAYGLSNQSFAKWAGDEVKGLLIGLVLGALTLWFPYWVLRKSPRLWWLWTSIAAIPVILALVFITPIVIDPMFNKFGPMKDKALEQKILALADKAGIEGSRVFEVEKSEDTKTVNAYVTGFMGSKRVVLWDTIIAKLDERQLLFAMGHEMGHYVLGHVKQGIVLACAAVFLVLSAAHRLSGGLIARFKGRFGFSELADIASLPLVLLIANLLGFVASPAVLAYTRHVEHEADRFGLELTRDNWAGASAFVRLQQENLGVPRPGRFYTIFRASHPVLGDRIDFCNEYRPWESGAPRKYESLFEK